MLGALILLIAVPTAFKVGPDDVVNTDVETLHGGRAVVLDERIVPFARATAFLRVSSDSDLFVGTANGVDVNDYVADTNYQLISDVDFPGNFRHRLVSGSSTLAAAPSDLDWWTSKSTGRSATVTFSTSDKPAYIVVTSRTGKKPITVNAEMGLEVGGVFGYCLIGFGLALILFAAAVYLFDGWRSRRLPPPRPLPQPGGGRTPGRSPRSSSGRASSGRRSAARVSRVIVGFAAGTAVLAASGCSAPARPRAVEPVAPTKIAMPRADAPGFVKGYSAELEKSYRHGLRGLGSIQAGPQLTRTRALAVTAKASGGTLSAPSYSSVVVASPRLTKYPMWFMARAAGGKPDYLLVERERATSRWHVVQTVHADRKLPELVGRKDGSVPTASARQSKELASSAESIAHFLQTGSKPDDGTRVDVKGLTSYRSYVGKLRNKKSGFTSVKPVCSVHDGRAMSRRAVKTEKSATSLAEIRCTLTVSVPSSFSLDLGSSIEALLGSKAGGNTIEVTSSHPVALSRMDDGTTEVASGDWYLIGAHSK